MGGPLNRHLGKSGAVLLHAGLLVAIGALIACGGGTSSTNSSATGTSSSPSAPTSPGSPPTSVSVSITPNTVSLVASNTQQFTATLSGTTNTAITWQVNGVTGGNSSVGTVSASGLYTAPAVTSNTSITVTAVSVDDATKSASAAVTVTPPSSQPGPTVKITISPTNVSVTGNNTQQFSATVSGSSNTAVTWKVNGVTGGNGSTGTVTSSGLYTAPAVTANTSVTITAVSVSDSTKSASAAVTVTPGNIGPSPTGPQYYVSTSGNDSNNGSASAPWRTISYATTRVSAGATVHVAPGTYNEDVIINDNSLSGTASDPIVFISDQQWGAKIVGDGSAPTFQLRTNDNYIDIVGFDISNPNGTQGIETYASYGRIEGNRVHNVSGGCPSEGGDAIHLYAGGYNVVNANLVYSIGNSSGACQLTQGIYSEDHDDVIENNIVVKTQGWGIHLWHAATRETVVNNTVVNNDQGGILVGCGDDGCSIDDFTTVNNNIVAFNGSVGGHFGIYETGTTGTHNSYNNNLVYNNSSANFSLQNGLTANATITANPLFVNYTGDQNGDYRLQASSPAIDKGTNASAPSNDYVGGLRPVGSAWDLGAYEYGSTPAAWPWY